MTDITITVAICLAAISASLLLAKQVAIEVARKYSYGAMIVFGAHIFGIVISAPVASVPAEIVAIASFAWLMLATLALSVRGFLRVMGDRGSTVKCS